MRVGDLLGAVVETESGKRLGRVYDLRGELGGTSLPVTGLVVGAFGLLERLGIGAPRSRARVRTHDVVPWSNVVRATRRRVIVSDDEEST